MDGFSRLKDKSPHWKGEGGVGVCGEKRERLENMKYCDLELY